MSPARVRLVLIATMALWGLNLSAMKVLTGHVDTLLLAILRMLLATVVMTGFAGRRLPTLLRLDRSQLLRIAICGALMVYANQFLMLSGMRLSSATNASLIIALSPLAALGVAAVVLRERLRGSVVLGVAVGFAGVCAAVFARPGAALSAGSAGDVLLLVSVVTFALGGALVQRLAGRLDPAVISAAIHALGTVMLSFHALATHALSLEPLGRLGAWTWMLLLFSGLVATGIGNLVWNRSISAVGVGRTTAALYWVPIFGIGFAIAALGETPSGWLLVGLGAVLAGTWITSRRGPIP